MFHFNFCTGSSITTAFINIKLWGKNISVVRDKSKIKYQKHLYWLQTYILDLKGKRFNSIIYLRRCGDRHKEICNQSFTMPNVIGMQGSVYMSFTLLQKIKCRETGISVVIFFSFAKSPVVKTTCENCSRSLRSRAFQLNICHVFIHCSSSYASLSIFL